MTHDPDAQVRKSRLKLCYTPTKIGRVFYSAPNFDLGPIIHKIIKIILKETGESIELAITNESVFEDEKERKAWYDQHGIKNNEDRELLNLSITSSSVILPELSSKVSDQQCYPE
eukprot:14938495-Ditylum_brightwellii.AAC.1